MKKLEKTKKEIEGNPKDMANDREKIKEFKNMPSLR